MALEIYEKAVVIVDGEILSESTTVSIDTDPKLNPIETMNKGFAGVSPGAEQTAISVESAVPRAGFDIDYLSRVQGVEVVEITVFAAAKKMTSNGFLTKVGQKYGVNQPASVSFEFIGEPIQSSTL